MIYCTIDGFQERIMKAIKRKPPRRLLTVLHYHQKAGCHPNPTKIPVGEERVELVTGGRGWVNDEGEWREVGACDLLWHSAGESTIGRSDFANPYRCLAVRFAVGTDTQPRPPRFSRWPNAEEVLHFTREAMSLFLDDGADRDALMTHLFGRLRLEALRRRRSAPPNSSHPVLQQALDLIDRGYAQSVRVGSLARECGCSTPHLHYLFRRHHGKTPNQVLLERRIRAARERLAMSDDPVKQIAYDCGFTHSAALCHAFKRLTGSPPGTFREHLRGSLFEKA